jgi:rhodanese-related sulfurtransferase
MAGEHTDQHHPHAPAAAESAPPLLHPQIPRIEPSDLADVLRKTDSDHKAPVIVDVRDAGTTGGFIRGAVNVPKSDFDDAAKIDALLAKLKDEPEIVFHCQHSQQRGPGAAFQFLERLEATRKESEHKPDVRVLRGGFHEFSQQFGDDADLVDARPLA